MIATQPLPTPTRNGKTRQIKPSAQGDPLPEPCVSRVMFTYGENLCDIQCGPCGHSADIGRWMMDSMGFPRGDNVYQCPNPACRYAFRIVKTPSGRPNRIEKSQPTL